jgi:hypothetical protein
MEHPKRGARIDAELEKEGEEALENWRRERNNSSRTITKITTTHTIPEKVGREWDDMYWGRIHAQTPEIYAQGSYLDWLRAPHCSNLL